MVPGSNGRLVALIPDDERLLFAASAMADRLLSASRGRGTRTSRRRAARMARLLEDPAGKQFTVALTDEVLRIREPGRAARRLHDLLDEQGAPRFLGPADRALLRAGAVLAPRLPAVVMPLVARRLRAESAGVILSAQRAAFDRHARRRRALGIRLNVNVLGEAVLGEEEARRRLDAVIERLSWPSVDYVSVKVSAIASQLDVLAFDESVTRITTRLRPLYAEAARHRPAKFVNLDMEEYRDLHLTATVLRSVLDEPAFHELDAGIALQAYLPDSFAVLTDIAEWARARRQAGGGRVKVRLVKGANLAMEQVDAELHGWAQAPYATKAEVDANYKRMLDVVLDGRFADAVVVGVASHNLFDLAWALVCRDASGAGGRVELEMLEGMAEAQARAVREEAGDLLLYAPVAHREDFASTIAYLVRRLDENTGPDNFLRRLFALAPDTPAWGEERERFVAAVGDRHRVSSSPRRTQDRSREARRFDPDAPFANEPDTDFALAANRAWIRTHLASWTASDVPVVTDVATVDQAFDVAREASARWRAIAPAERRAVLTRVAETMAARRGETIATMAFEAGKTVGEGDPEVSEAVDFARWYADGTRTIERLTADGLSFEPAGVVVVTSPWNFPYAIPAGGVLAALAAGNAVILKPAPETPMTGALVARHCWEAGVPPDVLQLLPCPDDDVGRRLVSHPDVGALILTGAWETAQLFRSWRPDLRLHAETSGKNAIVVTQAADLDGAVRDIVRSAFGHAGQKCSAASLAILEAAVFDDPAFRRQLRDAVTSLAVGPAWELATTMGPLIRPPAGPLADALHRLGPGESWLVEPHPLDERLWSPGVKLGVQPGSPFHLTECFGPVLGVMRAADLDEAIALQNATPFGLTGGIHSLDPAEVAVWLARVEVGNAYVNRHVTGAIVRRQPFGGWKRSAVGPGAKAGGPNYVLTMGRWRDEVHGPVDFEQAWREEFAVDHDPSGLRSEANVLRYRALPGGVVLRVGEGASESDVDVALAAARVAGVAVEVSRASDETDDAFAARVASVDVDKIRALGPVPSALQRAAAEAGLPLDDEPVVGRGRIELLRWVREQAVSITQHRYGNVQPRSVTRPG
jgi:RHH-type proline utilization regulon transcriptional repressor/proline dehydrogenase/delta 1-pyrroline-5-carboxylate dehydrogenase